METGSRSSRTCFTNAEAQSAQGMRRGSLCASRRPLRLCVETLFCLLVALAANGRGQTIDWWTAGALAKIRPGDPRPADAGRGVELFAARNEFEPFQLVLHSPAGDIDGVDVATSDLAGPAGSIGARQNITIYRESWITIKRPSSREGAVGDWPDPLTPRIDRYAGEKRNAFPLRLLQGRNQPLWVDVYVPIGTPPGKYEGRARILAGNKELASVPVSLTVWNFTLPSTSSLPTAFGFSGPAALKRHYGRYTNDADLYRLAAVYTRAGLLHRITLSGGAMIPPPMHNGRVQWGEYDKEVGPFLDGHALGRKDPLPGARLTSIDLVTPAYLGPAARIQYYKEWIRHFSEKGWLSRLYNYLWDEPSAQEYPKVLEKGRLAHRAGPGLRNLVTVPYHKDLASVVDFWVPLINCFESKPGFYEFCSQAVPVAGYSAERQAGKKLWWYQSCASHGCNGEGGHYFDGWPSYAIDVSPVANRIQEWLAFKYGIDGELYYATTEAYGRTANPWVDVYLHGGNGDGTLFYPGDPGRIGGATQIPVESIRLKLIREGMEDFEYLALLAQRGQGDYARQAVERLAPALYRWDSRPQGLYAVRRALGEKLNEMGEAGARRQEAGRSRQKPPASDS